MLPARRTVLDCRLGRDPMGSNGGTEVRGPPEVATWENGLSPGQKEIRSVEIVFPGNNYL